MKPFLKIVYLTDILENYSKYNLNLSWLLGLSNEGLCNSSVLLSVSVCSKYQVASRHSSCHSVGVKSPSCFFTLHIYFIEVYFTHDNMLNLNIQFNEFCQMYICITNIIIKIQKILMTQENSLKPLSHQTGNNHGSDF